MDDLLASGALRIEGAEQPETFGRLFPPPTPETEIYY